MLWKIDWHIVQRMLIDTVDRNENNNSDLDLENEVEINEDNVEDIMKSLEKYK